MASIRAAVVVRMESTHTTSASGAAEAKTSSLRLRLQKTISTCLVMGRSGRYCS